LERSPSISTKVSRNTKNEIPPVWSLAVAMTVLVCSTLMYTYFKR
jgi:hypothetical protein